MTFVVVAIGAAALAFAWLLARRANRARARREADRVAELLRGVSSLAESADFLRLVQRREVTKRWFDIVLGTVLLVLTAPVAAIAMLAVVGTSRGPALYRQTRVGRLGQPFEMLKIRTMVVNAEARTGPVLAVPSDPRVTRVGALLRRSHLDELPQLLNVVAGHMSLVGPRPERPGFVAEFERAHELYPLRHLVRPGLTGLAQIRASYASDVAEKLQHDLAYLGRSSLVVDLGILVRTGSAVFDSKSWESVAGEEAALAVVPASDPEPPTDQRHAG